MKTEKGVKVKKVDYTILSDKVCQTCGRPLKKNSETKGHRLCYVCFKISKGKKQANIYKVVNGVKTLEVIGVRDFIKEQKENISKYRHKNEKNIQTTARSSN